MVWDIFFCDDPCGDASSGHEKDTNKDMNAECDYDINCTPLFTNIEGKNWHAVVAFLDTGYWPYTFTRDVLTPAEQASTWVTRKELDDPKGTVKWSQLPLHLAIIVGAPVTILRRLIDKYPASIYCVDDEQMLPLHLALRHGADDSVVEYLLHLFPDAVNAQGKNSRTAIKFATRSGKKQRVKVLSMFVKQAAMSGKSGTESNDLAAYDDILMGKDQELEQLHGHLIILESEKHIVEKELQSRAQELQKTRQLLAQKAEELQEAVTIGKLDACCKFGNITSKSVIDESAENERYDIVKAAKEELNETEVRLRRDEALWQDDLKAVEECISTSIDDKDASKLEADVSSIKNRRFLHTRDGIMSELTPFQQMMNQSIQQNKSLVSKQQSIDDTAVMQKVSDGLDATDLEAISCEELLNLETAAMQKVLEGLDATEFDKVTPEELLKLKGDLLPIRVELEQKSEVAKVKKELMTLGRLLEHARSNISDMSTEDRNEVNGTLVCLEHSNLDQATPQQLYDLKERVRAAYVKALCGHYSRQVERELYDIEKEVNAGLEGSQGTTTTELNELAAAIQGLKMCEKKQTVKDILGMCAEVTLMKEALDQTNAASKLRQELISLRSDLETQLSLSQPRKSNSEKVKTALNLLDVEKIGKANATELDSLKKNLNNTFEKHTKHRYSIFPRKSAITTSERVAEQQISKKSSTWRKFFGSLRVKTMKERNKREDFIPSLKEVSESESSDGGDQIATISPPKGLRAPKSCDSSVSDTESMADSRKPMDVRALSKGDGSGRTFQPSTNHSARSLKAFKSTISAAVN